LRDFEHVGVKYKTGMILHHTADLSDPVFEASSYIEWMEGYVRDLKRGRYEVSRMGEIIRFSTLAQEGSDAVTHGVRVRANALFIPSRSIFSADCHRPSDCYFFAYRIKISVDVSSHTPEMRLVSRYWLITDKEGHADEVRGPGVIGEYPVMKPGAEFTYCSCCTLHTPDGTMEGEFLFQVQATKEIVAVTVARFQLNIK